MDGPYQSGQSHAGDGADQLDRLTIVDVTVSHSELFSFWLLVVHWEEETTSKNVCLSWTAKQGNNSSDGDGGCRYTGVKTTYTGGCRTPPTAGSWRGSSLPPRVGNECWLFETSDGWTVQLWSLRRCTLWTNMEADYTVSVCVCLLAVWKKGWGADSCKPRCHTCDMTKSLMLSYTALQCSGTIAHDHGDKSQHHHQTLSTTHWWHSKVKKKRVLDKKWRN